MERIAGTRHAGEPDLLSDTLDRKPPARRAARGIAVTGTTIHLHIGRFTVQFVAKGHFTFSKPVQEMGIMLIEMADHQSDILQGRALPVAQTPRDAVQSGPGHSYGISLFLDPFSRRLVITKQILTKINRRVAGILNQHGLHQRLHRQAVTLFQTQ